MDYLTQNKTRKFLSVLFGLFIISTFFPYIRIFPFSTDLQPNTLLIGLFIIFLLIRKTTPIAIPKKLLLLSIPVICGVFIFLLFDVTSNGIRSLGGYISVFIISISTFLIFRNGYKFKIKTLYYIILIWGIVGAIQFFFYKGFLSFLMSRFAFLESEGYGERGVSALSNEPSFYGSICFFLWITFITNKEYITVNRKTRFLVLVSLVAQMSLFASSSVSILYFLILGVAYVIMNSNKIVLIILVIALLSTSTFIGNYVLDFTEYLVGKNRVFNIIQIFIESKEELIYIDPSINERFFNVYISVRGSFENFLLPNGFDTFAEYKKSLMNSELSDLYWWTTDKHTRIQSGYGAILYELGAIGLIIPIIFNYFLYSYLKYDKKRFWIVAIAVNLTMFSTIPISLPLFSFLIGYFAYQSSEKIFLIK